MTLAAAPQSSTKTSYPTKADVLSHKTVHSESDTNVLRMWKAEHYTNKWKALNDGEKILALAWLAKSLAPGVNMTYGDYWATLLEGDDAPKIIAFKDNPSIISLLHEVGHVLWGESETLACVYSVKLFASVFPTEYRQLIWQGHMLKKDENT